jgi:hypothetical protein
MCRFWFAVLVVVGGCGQGEPLPLFVTSRGLDVYAAPGVEVRREMVEAVEVGALKGAGYQLGEVLTLRAWATVEAWGSLLALDALEVECGEESPGAIGCARGPVMTYAARAEVYCVELVLAHEFAHAIGSAADIPSGHDSRALFGGPFSVEWFGANELAGVGCW